MSKLAILAGQGELPKTIARLHSDAVFVTFDGVTAEAPGNDVFQTSYERFGELFDGLNARGITEVVFAGGLARPALNPANFDQKMMELAPKFMVAMQGGDDELLRAVIDAFESHGFRVRGAHELVPDLTAEPGLLVGASPSKTDLADIEKARAILHAIGPLDVGQGAVVSSGQVLGIETVQGTDEMLRFAALAGKTGGVLVKAPKPGQDLRVDMPALGPDTIDAAKAANLNGIAFDAGQVLLINKETLFAKADASGIFLLAQAT